QQPQVLTSIKKLILPGLGNPVWQELLTGKMQLNSSSIALNLLISKQKAAFAQAAQPSEKLAIVELIRGYFLKNYRMLKPELLLINRACAIREKTRYRLPEPDHAIWQQILQDDSFIPSNHIAYKLLLARLRAQVRTASSPAARVDAARRIRDFIKQNHKSMKQELVYLFKQANAALFTNFRETMMSGDGSISFTNSIVEKAAVADMIAQGDYMIIAGDERVLSDLPSGNWIAGTIPYFMTDEGGQIDQDRVYVTRLQGLPSNNPPRLTLYDAASISRIAQEAPQHGFTVLILPANSEVHLSYAQNAPDFPNMYFSPIIGWISGVHLSELADRKAKTGFGPAAGMLSDSKAAAMHIPLPEDTVANVQTVNLFTQ